MRKLGAIAFVFAGLMSLMQAITFIANTIAYATSASSALSASSLIGIGFSSLMLFIALGFIFFCVPLSQKVFRKDEGMDISVSAHDLLRAGFIILSLNFILSELSTLASNIVYYIQSGGEGLTFNWSVVAGSIVTVVLALLLMIFSNAVAGWFFSVKDSFKAADEGEDIKAKASAKKGKANAKSESKKETKKTDSKKDSSKKK